MEVAAEMYVPQEGSFFSSPLSGTPDGCARFACDGCPEERTCEIPRRTTPNTPRTTVIKKTVTSR